QREQLISLSKSLNSALQDFHTILKSRNTKRNTKKENEAVVKELIITELKESKQEREKSNLPMVVYDELKISGTYEAPASYFSLQMQKRSKSTPRANVKGEVNGKRANTKKGVSNSFTSKNDKDKSMIGGEGGLPPINEN